MATLDTTNKLSLLEVARRLDPKGEAAAIAEILNKTNAVLDDLMWLEANDLVSHTITRRSSLPSSTHRRINEGITPTASATTKVTETIAHYEARSVIDKMLLDLQPNKEVFRSDEASSFIEGMGQDFATDIFYANPVSDPDVFYGLAPRLDALQSHRVVSCGGSGSDLTSVYIVQHGARSFHAVYPRGSKTAGIQHQDLGETTVYDSSGRPYQAVQDLFTLDAGLAVHDDRAIARVCNIETAGTTSNLIDGYQAIMEVLAHMPGQGSNAVLYMNATAWNQLTVAADSKTNVNYDAKDPFGRPLMTFQGHPVRLCEDILDTESAVS